MPKYVMFKKEAVNNRWFAAGKYKLGTFYKIVRELNHHYEVSYTNNSSGYWIKKELLIEDNTKIGMLLYV